MTMRNVGRFAGALAVVSVTAVGFAGQSPDPRDASLVERASKYVDVYQQDFSAVVSEEHQIQKLVDRDGRVRRTREIKSDFLLVKLGSAWPVAFRDVVEVDRKPVRDRGDRLRKLFLDKPRAAPEQARAISKESERHNIGPGRSGNSPVLPLIFLLPKVVPRSRFVVTGSTLAFEEFQSPTVMGATSSGARRDVFARGWFEVDASSGRVLAAEVTGVSPPGNQSITLTVRFRDDPQLKLMVPIEVHEKYWRHDKPTDDRLEVSSSYSNFRRFQVIVSEEIKAP